MNKELKQEIARYIIRNYRLMNEYLADGNEELAQWFYNKTAGVEEMLTWCGYYVKTENGLIVDIVKDDTNGTNHHS